MFVFALGYFYLTLMIHAWGMRDTPGLWCMYVRVFCLFVCLFVKCVCCASVYVRVLVCFCFRSVCDAGGDQRGLQSRDPELPAFLRLLVCEARGRFESVF